MRVILVDDEKAGLDNLNFYLSKIPSVEILGMYQYPLDAMQSIVDQRPDAVFLDISMPEMDGLHMASEILRYDDRIKIVFATAFDEYAVKAFELNAIDYILKPYSFNRIEMAVNRIKKLLLSEDVSQQKKKREAIQFEATKKELIKIPVWKDERIFLCPPADISFLSAEEGYVKVCTCGGESYKSKETLSYFDEKLEQGKFFRCHKSYIVNIEKIKEVIPWFNNTYLLSMNGCTDKIPVSRKYIKSFRSLFDL